MKTITDIIAELEKIEDKSALLEIVASTDRESPEAGENFIDHGGVCHVSVNALDGRVNIRTGAGLLSAATTAARLRGAGRPESPIRLKIGFGVHPTTDSNGDPVSVRTVEDCSVEGAVLSLVLGEKTKAESED